MKIVLLLMAVIYLYNDWKPKALKIRFSSKAKAKQNFIDSIKIGEEMSVKSAGEDGKAIFSGLLIVFGLCWVILNILFSIFSACYISSFIFTLISVVMILITSLSFGEIVKCTYNPKTFKPKSLAFRITDLLFSTMYVLYVVYFVMMQYIK